MPVIERVLSVTEVNKVCNSIVGKEAGKGKVWWGCAKFSYYEDKKVCLIWRISDLKVRRHEIGHCSGWPGDHPMQEIKEAVAKPILPDWAHPTPQLPWPKTDPDMDIQVSAAAKELSRQIRR
jgi:hypothetical protein